MTFPLHRPANPEGGTEGVPTRVGAWVGLLVGSPSRTVGAADGTSVSMLYFAVGGRVGAAVGNAEGVGPTEGCKVGRSVGDPDGPTEGSKVGKRVGDPDGGGDRG